MGNEFPSQITHKWYDEEYYAGTKGGKAYHTTNGKVQKWSYFNPDGTWEGTKPIVQAWKTMFSPKNMLDVGCGRGQIVSAARDIGIEAEGFDFSEWAVGEGRYVKCKPEWLKLHDAMKPWPYSDKSFDLVVALDFWEHIYETDLPLVISEMFRVAKKWIFLQIAVAGSGGLQGRVEDGYILDKSKPIPIELEGCAVAGHVTLRKEAWWLDRFDHNDWILRRDMVTWFCSLVDSAIIRNWLLNSIIVMEKISQKNNPNRLPCALCRIYGSEREVVTKLYYEDKVCIVVECKSCHTPMFVLKHHVAVPTHEERLHMVTLADELFPKSYKRFTMRVIKDHFHFHVQEAFKKPLELGGGTAPIYHPNLDVRDLPTVDKVVDLSKEGIPYLDNSFDIVCNQHFLEHIPRHRLHFLVKEMYRVLMPNGMLEIIVPDFRVVAERLAKEGVPIGEKEVDVCCGEQNEEYLQYDTHYNIFTFQRLKELLEKHSFERVELIPPRPEWLFDDLHIIAFKGEVKGA